VSAAVAVLLLVAALVGSACSSGGGGAEPSGTLDEQAGAAFGRPSPPTADLRRPEVEGPVTGGQGRAVIGAGGFDLSTVGYVEEEFFISGEAASYTAEGALDPDGRWSVSEEGTSPYATRVLVRRPADPSAFDGTVWVEWLNVSGGLDASPDWTYSHVELIRSGASWVGVSAQEVGIVGGGGLTGASSLTDGFALKNADPERYATLSHPGDAYSYDMYTQAGTAVWFDADQLLGGLEPERVISIGESQSAFRLTTYVNALAPTTDVFDGFLIHSRGSGAAPLGAGLQGSDGVRVRDDLEVPVLTFSAETDVSGPDGLGYVDVRQPDTERFRSWEVAGTAHADAYLLGIGDADDGSGVADAQLFAAMQDPPTGLYGGIISCERGVNAGPHTYVLRAAVDALDHWVRSGEPPAPMPPLQTEADGAIARDAQGIALGGIRTPQVDAPVAALRGDGQSGSGFCFLFGTTEPFTADQLATSFGDHAGFVAQWSTAVDEAVGTGALLAADAEVLAGVAEDSTVPAS